MFQIVIVPLNSNAPAALFYRTREKAESQFQNIHQMQAGNIDADVLQGKDEFGVILSIPIANVAYALFIDLEKQSELGITPPQNKPSKVIGI